MPFRYAYILPILCPVWFYATFIVTYIISVYKKDVTPVFPYISDTGTWSPESCIFGIMLNIGAVILGLTMYIRYRQIKYLLHKDNSLPKHIKKRNTSSLTVGIIACFGVCIVGNFQESNAFEVHIFGAFVAFGLGFIYQCIETKTSFQLYPVIGNKTINYIRIICCVVSTSTFFLTFVFAVIALSQFKGKDPTKWSENDGGYVDHFVSAVSEWIMATTTMFFLSLYTNEFRKIYLNEPPVTETNQNA